MRDLHLDLIDIEIGCHRTNLSFPVPVPPLFRPFFVSFRFVSQALSRQYHAFDATDLNGSAAKVTTAYFINASESVCRGEKPHPLERNNTPTS